MLQQVKTFWVAASRPEPLCLPSSAQLVASSRGNKTYPSVPGFAFYLWTFFTTVLEVTSVMRTR
ncbi:hypothetical protein E2C01_035847 [Portunus trituberculatus]|uniref:Uncharacterized protein n=1 Tax=Portunus trituberculatus TaxID=210409 RepID=A0A5B7F5E9_PORTR|nr:hypothetical protein [Portunus trituberculatus]